MWKKQKKNNSIVPCIDTLIAADVVVEGNIRYRGGIQIDGTVCGNIVAENDEEESLVRITSSGRVNGDLVGPNVIINGRVDGNVHSSKHLELAPRATVVGNVHYNLIEMLAGSEVNGNLYHITDQNEVQGSPESAAAPSDSQLVNSQLGSGESESEGDGAHSPSGD